MRSDAQASSGPGVGIGIAALLDEPAQRVMKTG